jgi:hypothetical protein
MKAFSRKKIANYSFKSMGNFKNFPYILRPDEGQVLGQGRAISDQISVLPENKSKGYIIDKTDNHNDRLENRGPLKSPYCDILASIFLPIKETE